MFSSDSRWDRHTPEQARHEEVIDVGVLFKGGKVIPTKERKIHNEKVMEVGFCQKCGAWKGQLGLEPTFDLYIKHL